jgi:AraC-like DNA-binding protein
MSTKELNLRKLDYSPTVNPLVEDNEIRVRQKLVRTRSTPSDLLDPETGEVTAATLIHTVETVDEEHFVKVFIDGTKKAFDLTRTASRAFQAILEEYQKEKMSGGYAESVQLYWFGDGLNGEALNMSEKTFQRGLKELMQKNFLSPKIPNVYWVNPNLFFRGNRVAFMKEYRKKVSNTITDQQNKLPQQDP